MLRLILCAFLISADTALIASNHFWVSLLGLLLLALILAAFEDSAIRAYRRSVLPPFMYHCTPCHNRGAPCEFRCESEDALRQAVAEHNRTVHLMEP